MKSRQREPAAVSRKISYQKKRIKTFKILSAFKSSYANILIYLKKSRRLMNSYNEKKKK